MEWDRLLKSWAPKSSNKQQADDDSLLYEVMGEQAKKLDLFDKPQLACVICECRNSASCSEAGRRLFANSRLLKKSNNDADRVRKYLASFGLDWKQVSGK